MKTFLITITIFLLLQGCTARNAFDKFNISENRAKSEDSILSSKIYNKEKVNGIISVVYLNDIFPERYKGNEYFYVSLYTKEKKEPLLFYLNGKEAFEIEELNANNEFNTLTSLKAKWQKHYLINFIQQGKSLTFSTKNSLFSSDKIVFKKAD